MSETATPSLPDHLANFIERLVEAARVAMGMPVINRFIATLAWGRMRRLEERFLRLKARFEAETLRRPRARRDAEAEMGDSEPERIRRPPLPFLPRTFGWFARMVPGAGPAAQEFEQLLAAPEMSGLVSAAPQAGRILRPLAHMLGVRRPAFLRLPRRRRVPRKGRAANTPHPPASSPQSAEVKATDDPPPAQPPPQPSRSWEEERALAHARRPGGLYWDGTGFRWS